MKIGKISIAIPILAIIWPLLFNAPAAGAQANIDPGFNHNRILEDWDVLNYDSMNLAQIQNFLQGKGSFLATYSATSTHGVLKTAAEIIYDATHNNYDCDDVILSDQPTEAEKSAKCRHITTVNPKLLLVLLQKEQSLIEDARPDQKALDWATGYGCPDNWACNPYYKGFGKQVNSAALQFRAYMLESHNYKYKVGQTYEITNTVGAYVGDANRTSLVTPQNLATAALYNYTPHVYNGNYNAYKIWNRYFPKIERLYPDGSLIQAEGDPRIWLISGGQKRHFANWSAFASRFRLEQVVKVAADELDKYSNGEEIKFSNYSLVQTPEQKIYLLVDNEKRPFASAAVFKKIGFNPEELESATEADLASYRLGKAITTTSTYVTGALMQDSQTSDLYYVENGTRALVDKVLLPLKFAGQKITKKTTKQLAGYAETAPVLLNEGALVRTENFPTVYLISGGKKRPFVDDASFAKLNYNPANIVTVSSQFLYNYDMGEAIK